METPLDRLRAIAARVKELDEERTALVAERRAIFRQTKGVFTTRAILDAAQVSEATYRTGVR